MLPEILILFIGFAGILLALYLHHKKQEKKEAFICPLHGNCSDVIQSKFSKFMGVPVEWIGVFYYAAITIGYGLHISFSENGWLLLLLSVLSTSAFLFSVYLTFIQVVALRKVCTWCLLSAAFCTAIFSLTMISAFSSVQPFLMMYRDFFTILHVLFLALGLGAATLADVFFFKFLKDFRIAEQEAMVLDTISQFSWFIMALIVMSGLALYLPVSFSFHASFAVQIIMIIVIMVNAACLNFLVTPKLMRISFGQTHEHEQGELVRARRTAFTLGPISTVSWYSVFLLTIIDGRSIAALNVFIAYIAFLVMGILIGHLLHHRFSKQARYNIS